MKLPSLKIFESKYSNVNKKFLSKTAKNSSINLTIKLSL